MKKILVFILLVSISFVSFAQKKILIDNIHGADFVGDAGGQYSTPINFSNVFPNDELTILTPDSFPITELYEDEIITGLNEKSYGLDIPWFYTPVCMYIYVKCSSDDHFERANGVIINPLGEISGELFQGAAHVENVEAGVWTIELDLDSLLTYDVKIGIGDFLFKNGVANWKFDLNDFDAMVRLTDNCAYALVGNPPLYENYDLTSLSEAFTNGLSFIHTDHNFNSMADKPFIHFYSDEEVNIDVNIEFPGNFTLLSSNPKLSVNKSEEVINSTWEDHKLSTDSNNEIVYEGGLKNKLNFLDFDFFGDQVTIENRIVNYLNDIFIFKYESENLYKFKNAGALSPLSTIEVSDWDYLNTEQVIEIVKRAFFEKGISEGLLNGEMDHLVNDYHWIESLLYRAKINKDEYFGFYHFGKDVYDKLIGYNSDPYPEELNRTMWVMLSFIKERSSESIITLDREVFRNPIKKGLKVNEYGVVDEYYTDSYFKSEEDLFGIDTYEHIWSWMIYNLNFYDNPIASQIANGSSTVGILQGTFTYNYADYSTKGILYPEGDETHPAAYGKVINENGQLVVVGTSYFFKDGNTSGHNFLNTTVTELVDNRILTGIAPASNIITEFDLQAYPNPFNPSTQIEFSLKKGSYVELTIYNFNGQEVAKLANSKLEKGSFRYEFNAKDQASGVYNCILKVDGKVVDTKKMMLLK